MYSEVEKIVYRASWRVELSEEDGERAFQQQLPYHKQSRFGVVYEIDDWRLCLVGDHDRQE
jgi:hypothetical protein